MTLRDGNSLQGQVSHFYIYKIDKEKRNDTAFKTIKPTRNDVKASNPLRGG